MVKNFASLQQQVQIVKDAYYKLIKTAAAGMSHEYQLLSGKIDAVSRDLKNHYPAGPNAQIQSKIDVLKSYANKRTISDVTLEYSITCSKCGFSLSDILNYTAQAPLKENELAILQSGFIPEVPKPEITSQPNSPESVSISSPAPKKPRKVTLSISKRIMTVQEYKLLLTSQLTALAAAKPDDEIELEIEGI